jgi:hypothetical protein
VWTNVHLHVAQEDNGGEQPAQRRAVDEVRAAIPRPCRAGAVVAVRPAAFAGETDAQRRCREQREVQLEAARLATKVCQQAQEDAVAAEATNQGRSPPRAEDEWMDHLKKGLEPSIHHVLDRFGDGSDRDQQVLCTEQPDSSILCAHKLSGREGLVNLSRHCEHVIHSTKIPSSNLSKLAGSTAKPRPTWLS